MVWTDTRKGQFTIADLLGVALLVFIFGVAFGPMTDAISTSFEGANLLTKAALVVVIPTLLFAILGYTIVESGREEEPERRRVTGQRGQRARRRRRR